MTDTLIARLRDATTGNLFADRVEAADRIEYQDKLIEQFGGISKDAMEQCFALTKDRDEAADRIEALQSRLTALEGQEPVAWKYQEATHPEGDLRGRGWRFHQFSMSKPNRPWMQDDVIPLYLAAGAAPTKEPPRFPTMLRKMWSGSEVQDWINANWDAPSKKTKPNCKECAKWTKEQADNREWIEGVAEGKRIVEALVAKELRCRTS